MGKSKLKRIILITAGSTSVGLAAIGIVIPVLPTTPFLLLACFCFARSSKRLHYWLFHNRLFGPHIKNYAKHKAVTKSTKIGALVFLWAGLVLSAFIVAKLSIGLILLAVGTAVTVHILVLKTL